MLNRTFSKFFNIKLWFYISLRHNSSYKPNKSSHEIRKRFLDYFNKENDHVFVRSSPIVPYCDPTVPFVNAGMNQFKGVFLGLQQPVSTKIANSQKCARVGGKHNDLNIIGQDGYHHTFFEMLGNWSFGDYSKKRACELAWNLLVGPYNISPDRLYVTYFEGDKGHNLEPDMECKHIWREIGVPEDRIIPFGMKDNFWEMGSTGPCGPCTEIHIDHLSTSANRRDHVNKGFGDLTELWNIVFIQYNRIASGAVVPLPKCHIDTGMGFERLVSVIQNCKTNYDTDLFAPLFNTILNNSKSVIKPYKGTFGEDDQAKLDTAYRILADHCRLITVCLADGMIPDLNPKLRRILRKALLLCEKYFNTNASLLKVLSNSVAESLGETYPEIVKNLNKVHNLIHHEEEVLRALRLDASKKWQNILNESPELINLDVIEFPGLVSGYKEIQNALTTGSKTLTSELAYKLCDTYGFDEDVIQNIADIKGLHFDKNDFDNFVDNKKAQSKQMSSRYTQKELYDLIGSFQQTIPTTDNSFKYNYNYDDKYIFPKLQAKVKAIIVDNTSVKEITKPSEASIILDKSNFYHESGGQESDTGKIIINNDVYFEVTSVINVQNYITHKGKFITPNNSNFCLKLDDTVFAEIDGERRLNNMRNHTGVHLLQAAVNKILPHCVIAQTSSKVCSEYFSLGLAIYGDRISMKHIDGIETQIRKIINQGIPIGVNSINSQKLLAMDDVTLVPGEVYPDDDIRIIEVSNDNFLSKEACCGTHILNTKHLEEFSITKFQNLSRSNMVFYGATGHKAKDVLENSKLIENKVETLQKRITENNTTKSCINELKSEINNTTLSYVTKMQSLEIIDDLIKSSNQFQYQNLKDFIDVEMKDVMDSLKANKGSFLVHNLICASLMENVKLDKVTRYCKDKPVIIFSYSNGYVKARCCVPEDCTSESFNAQKWLKISADIFKAHVGPPKGQNENFICNMKAKKILEPEWYDLLEKAVQLSNEYAKVHINK